ncbi:hypothetical protein [Anaerocolumna chitinilytica]|uniref:Uncharacterized protein n=1 Tax=Anaerocolumna chitinilytica TaxID=1727145 RepID=A0A7I8DQE3_9FIRM|nr:hypothetical protein [Anaerocolumna chitinilytica]BCK00639.1 hypothetical protein bsdcttw_36790 [Anaerocolumna chitinilytica]
MKKYAFVILILIALLLICPVKYQNTNSYNNKAYYPLDQLQNDYSLADAKVDNCVVYENGDITYGQSVWDSFTAKTQKGKPATVRLAFYYTLDAPSHYAKEYYESIKAEYPVLYIKDLRFDGNKYVIAGFEEGTLYEKEYKYMMKYKGEPRSPSALFQKYTRYVLVNDNTATWEDIEDGALSSRFGASIDNYPVYTDLTWK